MSWVEGRSHIPEPVIKYEDLVSEEFDFDDLSTRTGLEITPGEAMSKKAGASRKKEGYRLNRRTRSVIRRIAAAGLQEYGYEARS